MEQGTINAPWSATTAIQKGLAGEKAVYAVEKSLNVKLTEPQKAVVHAEGYVPGYYKDIKGNITKGVGQTGEYINQTFVQTYEKHQEKAEAIFGELGKFHPKIQGEIMKATYRGDVNVNHKWVHDFKKGNYEAAAADFLINNEYLQYKRKGIKNGVTERFETFANTLVQYAAYIKYKKQGLIK